MFQCSILIGVAGFVLLATTLAEAAEKDFPPNESGQIAFITPSRNIGCIFTPAGGTEVYEPADGGPELSCDRVEPAYVRLILDAKGPATLLKNVGDASCCSEDHVLEYRETWRHGAYSCQSKTDGLECRRDDGHGFIASRKTLKTH